MSRVASQRNSRFILKPNSDVVSILTQTSLSQNVFKTLDKIYHDKNPAEPSRFKQFLIVFCSKIIPVTYLVQYLAKNVANRKLVGGGSTIKQVGEKNSDSNIKILHISWLH